MDELVCPRSVCRWYRTPAPRPIGPFGAAGSPQGYAAMIYSSQTSPGCCISSSSATRRWLTRSLLALCGLFLLSLWSTPMSIVSLMADSSTTVRKSSGQEVQHVVQLQEVDLVSSSQYAKGLAPEVSSLAKDGSYGDDFYFCRTPLVGNPKEELEHMDIFFLCQGQAYERFGRELEHFSKWMIRQSKRPPSWGHRPTSLPTNTTILAIGNSHLRQVAQALAGQHANQVVRVERLHVDQVDSHMVTKIFFHNGATLWIVANTYAVHSPHWQRLLEEQLGVDLESFDAIVRGAFNRCNPLTMKMEALQAAEDQVNCLLHGGPTVADFAAVFPKPMIFVSMFSMIRAPQTNQARREIQALRQERGNLQLCSGHTYIDLLQRDCGSHARDKISPCVPGKSAAEMHRCLGDQGGHPDLIAWDVSEFLAGVLHE